jgi:hypothetical protein
MEFGTLKKLTPHNIWKNEATDFTPWLAENISSLGEALGMELELEKREASVGNFSLDLLAKDLSTGSFAIIENQLTQTDHDHLGKLLTYAAGFDATVVIWVAESIRDEHRQAVEWLNQHTDIKTNFFAVIVEVFKIDQSNPAFRFRPIVYPNEWQKTKRQLTTNSTSPKAQAYRAFFQKLIDDLRDKHKFTGAKLGQPQNWYSFASGYSYISYSATFCQNKKVRVELYIGTTDAERNKSIFDKLKSDKVNIEQEFGHPLSWERLDDKQASRICVYRNGSIEDVGNLQDIHIWIVDNMLKFKQIFNSRLEN